MSKGDALYFIVINHSGLLYHRLPAIILSSARRRRSRDGRGKTFLLQQSDIAVQQCLRGVNDVHYPNSCRHNRSCFCSSIPIINSLLALLFLSDPNTSSIGYRISAQDNCSIVYVFVLLEIGYITVPESLLLIAKTKVFIERLNRRSPNRDSRKDALASFVSN
ncbi:hypothetical protein BX666DRAFT_479937 [Dichotomocladium elegans]|nr:hypothetical protein BX666DRAFT_479937 [Dichotomocladium elegans]